MIAAMSGVPRFGLAALVAGLVACGEPSAPAVYDVVIRNGAIHDGSGSDPYVGDLGISGDTIAAVSAEPLARGRVELDASGLAVAPGFINTHSRADRSLLRDGHAYSDVRQGVTLEVFASGCSMGPLNLSMKSDLGVPMEWSSLGDYLEHLAARGVSTNVAAFVGATTLRVHVLGYQDRSASESELERMRALARGAMLEGALGVASSLDRTPGSYADTEELIALAEVAGEFGGLYASRIRSNGNLLLQAVEELITVATEAQLRASIQGLEVAGHENWAKIDSVFERLDQARADGVNISASTNVYTAIAADLAAALPPEMRDAEGLPRLDRLRQPYVREELVQRINEPGDLWESPYRAAKSADDILLTGFLNPALRPLAGMTLARVAARRGTSPEAAAIELILEDASPVGAVFFVLSEENVRKKIRQDWISFGSGAPALAWELDPPEPAPHPAAFGNFARMLGLYVREEKIIPLPEAIRRLTSLPAADLGIRRRGILRSGYFADIVVFDPAAVKDHADYESPRRYATGVRHLLVNGKLILRDGWHTRAMSGRVVRGPGWSGQGERTVDSGPR